MGLDNFPTIREFAQSKFSTDADIFLSVFGQHFADYRVIETRGVLLTEHTHVTCNLSDGKRTTFRYTIQEGIKVIAVYFLTDAELNPLAPPR